MQGASWQHPLIRAGLFALDPLDAAVRKGRGLKHLPRYSARVRSNGVSGQFGGEKFDREGKGVLHLLRQYCNLCPESRVLEIGCGSGRTAVQLADFLKPGRYTGMDIERVSLDACRNNQRLASQDFRFDLIDIQNNEYNPNGRFRADEYRFSYPDGSIDTVFLMSVFTHMLPKHINHYISEIGRMLDGGGACLFSTFLLDHGRGQGGITFTHDGEGFSYYDSRMPEVAVAYPQHFFEDGFARAGLALEKTMLGSWRGDGRTSETELAQDVLVFKKVADQR